MSSPERWTSLGTFAWAVSGPSDAEDSRRCREMSAVPKPALTSYCASERAGVREPRDTLTAMANMNNMMRQAQALQRKLAEAQSELADEEVTGSAGGGMVTVRVTGSGEVRGVTIAPEVVDPQDVELLQDMVMAAVNEGLRASKELESQRLGGLASGLGLPPGLV